MRSRKLGKETVPAKRPTRPSTLTAGERFDAEVQAIVKRGLTRNYSTASARVRVASETGRAAAERDVIGDGALRSETARSGARIGAKAVHASLSGRALGVCQTLGTAALIAGPDEAGQAYANRRAGR